ncbi:MULTISPECIES: hypothetical protein [Gulosibacter]|uniref:hypothetical protein n=1 Tax=Gulosibacter TaxID=256818 RepID=UPI000F63265A|nr:MULTISPECIES: hypothetical protein [Gulosibacter]
MALSRKNKRKVNRLRKDADRLWSEQQAVFAKVRDLAGRAGDEARVYADKEIAPVIRKKVDKDLRPAFDRGVKQGRRALSGANEQFQHRVLPAVAQVGGNVTGAVREFVDNNQTLQTVQAKAQDFGKNAAANVEKVQARVAKEQKKLEKQAKKDAKSGPGVGGWFLIGAGVAAVAAVGYALWQTFRADDDLWIADEELDAPVKTVSND